MLIIATLVQALLLERVAGSSVDLGQAGQEHAERVRRRRGPEHRRHSDDLIAEESTVDNKAKRDLQKETARSSDFNGELNIDHILPSIPGFTMEANSSNALKGKADFKDERSFVDRVSVVVLDVLPNGNLVVIGTRDRNIAGDIQTIEVSGIVRPSDIAFDNTRQERAGRELPHRDARTAEFRRRSRSRAGWGGSSTCLWPW